MLPNHALGGGRGWPRQQVTPYANKAPAAKPGSLGTTIETGLTQELALQLEQGR